MFQDLQLLYGSDISTHITHWIYKWKLVPSVDVWRVKYFPLHNLMFTLVVNIRGNCNPLFYSIFFYMFFSPHNISWQLRRSRGKCAGLWYFSSWVQTQWKNSQHAFLWRGSKAVGPMLYFAACKRSQNGVEVVILAKFTGQYSHP